MSEKTKLDIRNEFLLKMYEAFWNNITRAEDTTWKMMATYTALFAGLAFSVPYIGLAGFDSIIAVFSFLAVAVSVNANLWFVRNIAIIGSIENELLLSSDYHKIIPEVWKGKPPFFAWNAIEIWWLLVPMFVAVPLLTYAATFAALGSYGQTVVAILLTTLFVLTVAYTWNLKRRYDKFIVDTSSNTPKDTRQKGGPP